MLYGKSWSCILLLTLKLYFKLKIISSVFSWFNINIFALIQQLILVWQRNITDSAESDIFRVLWYQTVQCHVNTKMATTLATFDIGEAGIDDYRNTRNNGTNRHIKYLTTDMSRSSHVIHKSITAKLSCELTNIMTVIKM